MKKDTMRREMAIVDNADLTDLASQYLDPDWAKTRREYLRGLA